MATSTARRRGVGMARNPGRPRLDQPSHAARFRHFSSYPAGFYLFTARHTIDLNNVSHTEPVYVPLGQMNLDTQFGKAAPFSSAYVFATYRWDFIKKMEWGLEPVLRYESAHPGRLEREWSTPDGHMIIYRLFPTAGTNGGRG